eukprot:CAMPEP_0169373776 /NCGR_PEP_ID=MMETSP1017-20121227/37183_1 /TAXON_ID=342587 /ORGANISM="Karlodinium micrum, Strain CCMP2283" /LENGTH=124 /DNA_ID=CAMNT_0009472507 /DNA_START=56 /DNA_END=427 /DNA_ORIENTATION=-
MDAAEMAKAKQAASQMQKQEVDMKKMQEQQQQQAERAEQKRAMIRTLCEPDAYDRLQRVGLVKQETQEKVEMMLLQMAQAGHLQEKATDGQIAQLLEKVGQSVSAAADSKVKFVRKKRGDDSDS